MSSAPRSVPSHPEAGPGRAYPAYVLGLLFVVYVSNFVDRQILSILLEPIKRDLGASDTAMGFLTGFAFALFYTFAGIPIARWADRGVRRSIIAMGLSVWSAMTALSGLSRVYWQLAVARIGVGIGEAACSPPAHSLISDYFPPERRATALAVYAMGIHVGVLVGLWVGGWVNEAYGWRVAFFVVGAPGLVLALVVRLTVREPQRGASDAPVGVTPAAPPCAPEAAPDIPSTQEVLHYLWTLRSFRHLALAAAFMSFAGYGMATWSPAFLMRVHGMGTADIGFWLGWIAGLSGAAGALLGGLLADRLASRDPRWMLWLPAGAAVFAIPFAGCFLLWPTPITGILLSIPSTLAGAVWLGPVFSTAQNLARLRMRSVASAILLFVINLIGLGLGPQAVGVLNDTLFAQHAEAAVRWSLLSVLLVMKLWAALHFVLAARTLREDLETARAEIA